MTGLLRAFGTAVVLLSGVASQAQEADIIVAADYLRMNWETVSGEVAFGDLNLATDKGVETLKSRVEVEARKLCGVPDTTPRGRINQNKCYDSVLASADPQIERLSAAARGR
ncbi:MAG: UrcA family protein [Sandarakinorhabdus sp.]|nr:UrcA family protein [Sandarakinorhabdus sp.]